MVRLPQGLACRNALAWLNPAFVPWTIGRGGHAGAETAVCSESY